MPGEIDFSAPLSGPQTGLLVDTLAELFGDQGTLNAFLVVNGLPGAAMYGDGLPLPQLGLKVVQDAWRKGDLEHLVDRIHQQFPRSPVLRNFNEKLISLAGPMNVPSALACVERDPLEWFIREGGFGSPLLLSTAIVRASSRTGRIQLPKGDRTAYGTGFLVGPDLLLTAYHVVKRLHEGADDVRRAVVTFGFVEAEDGPQQPENVGFAPANWILSWKPYSKSDLEPESGIAAGNELDFALLRLAKPLGKVRGWYELKDAAAPPETASPIWIFQHPKGEVQQYSFGWTLPERRAPHRLRYDANTFGGSSGGLVLNDRMQPVALHHAGDPLDEEMVHEYNQGIPLNEIHAAIVETV